jgi:hypothetical protein
VAAERLKSQGNQKFKDQDFDAAIGLYVVQSEPAFLQLSSVALISRRPMPICAGHCIHLILLSRRSYTQAIEADPNSLGASKCYANRAACHGRLRDYDNVIADCTKGVGVTWLPVPAFPTPAWGYHKYCAVRFEM